MLETDRESAGFDKPGIFDSHAHYDDKQFDPDREELLIGMSERGVEYILNAGSSVETTLKTVELTKKYPFVYGSAGVHPEECGDMTEADVEIIRKAVLENEKIVAIGEIGLDYYWPGPDRDIQKIWFEKQLRLAGELNYPVIIHSREAAEDTMAYLKKHTSSLPAGRCGIVHCFSGSVEYALEYIRMGYYIGIGGVLTFKNAQKLKQVAQAVPIERIVIETDCPYMAPVPHRGKRNDSGYLVHVVAELADIKGLAPEEVVRITRDNALRVYGIEEAN